jgi:hypothetical protein
MDTDAQVQVDLVLPNHEVRLDPHSLMIFSYFSR